MFLISRILSDNASHEEIELRNLFYEYLCTKHVNISGLGKNTLHVHRQLCSHDTSIQNVILRNQLSEDMQKLQQEQFNIC